MSSEEIREEERVTAEELPIKEDLLSKTQLIQIGVTPYRFVIVIIYCLLNFCNAVHWVTFASCASNFGKNYSLSSFQVDFLSMVYMIIYPFACVPEAYLIDNKSMKIGIIVASILTITGAGIKCLINKGLLWVYLGQSLIPLFQPAILNCPGKIASTWFGEQSRVLVTSICCVSNTIGVLFGYLVHDWIIDSFAIGETFKEQFELYLFVEFCFTAALCLPTIFLMRSKPKIPPSNSQSNYQSPPLGKSLLMLFKNRNFMKVLISSTCVVGFMNIFGTIVNGYLVLYGISDEGITYTAAVANLAGIFAAMAISCVVDKIKQYKKILIILNSVGLVALCLVTALLELFPGKGVYIAFPMYTVIISSLVPVYTTEMDYVCELTYPVGESTSEGLIMSSNQVSGVIGILLFDLFMKYDWLKQHKFLPNILGVTFAFISLCSLLTIEERLIRHEKDMENSKPKEEFTETAMNKEYGSRAV